jgi:hypothetical protein
MASPDLFALSHSALNPFLYADIGPLDGAGTMTIASLFGRSGCDPWAEAARLARLPAKAAVASLAAMIADTPAIERSLPEATALAEELVTLLPRPTAGKRLTGARPAHHANFGRLANVALVLAVLVVAVSAWVMMSDAWTSHGAPDRARVADPFGHAAAP